MPVTLQVTRGYTAAEGTPITVDDFNSGFLPGVKLLGEIIEKGGGTSADMVAGPYFTGASTGSAGNYILTLTPAPTALPNGMWVGFLANHANPGAATLNVNGLGSKAVVTQSGQALTGTEIVIGQPVWVQYYLADNHWRMYSTSSKQEPKFYAQDVGLADAYVVTYAGLDATSTVQLIGVPLYFLAGNANTGASTLAVNGLTATPILKGGGTALSSGDIPADSIVGVMFDGSDYKLIGFVEAPALPSVGATGTHTRPYSITVDAQGRVTAVSGSTANIYESAATALPSAGAAATFTHGLSRIPQFVDVALRCTDAGGDATYALNDEVSAEHFDASSQPCFAIIRSASTIIVARANTTPAVLGKTGAGGMSAIDPTKWRLIVRAS